MKKHLKRLNLAKPLVALVAIIAAVALLASDARAQTQPVQAAPDELSIPMLQADAALSVKVSLEARRLALRDLLAQLQKQSAITLTAAEDAPTAETRVTARVKDMSLATFMGVLSRLYGVRWAKGGGNSYVMHGSDRGELHRKLLQMGDPVRYRFRYDFYTRRERQEGNKALANEVLQAVDATALHSNEGVALSSLPVVLQERVRRAVQEPSAERLAVKLYGVGQILSQDLVLRFNPASKGVTQMSGHTHIWGMNPNSLHFTVQTANGQFVAPVFPSLNFPLVSADAAREPRPSRRR